MSKGPEGYPGGSENSNGESLADEIKESIIESKEKVDKFFNICLQQSEDYQRALKLSSDQIKSLEKAQEPAGPKLENKFDKAKIKFKVENEEFAIISGHVSCLNYEIPESWKDLLMVIAKNPELNSSEGNGTSWINVVPKEWHQKILTTLTGEEPIDFDEITPEDIIGTE